MLQLRTSQQSVITQLNRDQTILKVIGRCRSGVGINPAVLPLGVNQDTIVNQDAVVGLGRAIAKEAYSIDPAPKLALSCPTPKDLPPSPSLFFPTIAPLPPSCFKLPALPSWGTPNTPLQHLSSSNLVHCRIGTSFRQSCYVL
ncbi:uncharacterized protein [Physcomitrium patens]|uniref:uncharacterized protein isoform X1 n=1 Tax=Physcomitrium patens TaxID=3218 RepID=UPI003CCDF655